MGSSKMGCGLVTVGSSRIKGNEEIDSEDEAPLSPWLACTSYCFLLFIVALFLLQVASISKFNGTRLSSEILPRIQEGKQLLSRLTRLKSQL